MKLQSVALYQPGDQLTQRMPGGARALADYIDRLLLAVDAGVPAHGIESLALIVALTPAAQGFWMVGPDGAPMDPGRWRPMLDAVIRPEVAGGPVAFAMFCGGPGEERPTDSGPPIPPEWVAVARERGETVSLEDVLLQLLPGPDRTGSPSRA